MIKNTFLAIALATTFWSAQVSALVEDPLMLRVRWLVIPPERNNNPISPFGGTASVDTNIAPEIDISYLFTKNIAAELITAVSQHRARGNGITTKHGEANFNMGYVSLLPFTLTLQWHFCPDSFLDPYLGAGVNYTYFYGASSGSYYPYVKYKNSFGGALQTGLNINFKDRWHVNLDIKKVYIDTKARLQLDPTLTGPLLFQTDIDINPLIIGIGIGYRF